MVVMQNKCGQLGNRLILFSHFIANAIHHGYRLFNPTFDEYTRWFPVTRQNRFAPYPISVDGRGWLSAAAFERLTYLAGKVAPRSPWHAFIRWRGDQPYDLNAPAFVAQARSKTVLVFGWAFRDVPHLVEHGDLVRGFFTPDASIMDAAQRITEPCRGGGDVLIGVHVRRGDYQRFKHGRYAYPPAVYADKMAQTASLFAKAGQRVRFLVCSNEPVAAADFPDLELVRSPGGMIEDLYALAGCDCLIGPPSTFSMWASFYGRTPLCWIRSAGQVVTRAAFTCDLADPQ